MATTTHAAVLEFKFTLPRRKSRDECEMFLESEDSETSASGIIVEVLELNWDTEEDSEMIEDVDPREIEKEFYSCAKQKGLHYLTRASAVVDKYEGIKVPLKKPQHSVLKIGGLDHTIYKGENAIVEEWGNFYLPKKVKMEVVGVVESFPCQSGQLVLMTCEDKRLFAYDGEELHVVASSLGDVFKKGFEYPGIKTFYRGESFKAMSQRDWAKVRKGSVGERLDQAHLDLVRKEKKSFTECLEVIRHTRKMAKKVVQR